MIKPSETRVVITEKERERQLPYKEKLVRKHLIRKFPEQWRCKMFINF